MKMNKRTKNIISVVIFLVGLSMFLYVMYCHFSKEETKIHNTLIDKVSIMIAEDKYKQNPTSENLFGLCSSMLHTEEIDKIRKYYPMFLTMDNVTEVITEFCSEEQKDYNYPEQYYNLFLSYYLIAEGVSDDCDVIKMSQFIKMQQGYSLIEVVHINMLVYFKGKPAELEMFLSNLEKCNDYVDDEYHKEVIELILESYYEELENINQSIK